MRNTIYSIKHALIKGAAAMMAAVICTTTLAGCGGSGNSGGGSAESPAATETTDTTVAENTSSESVVSDRSAGDETASFEEIMSSDHMAVDEAYAQLKDVSTDDAKQAEFIQKLKDLKDCSGKFANTTESGNRYSADVAFYLSSGKIYCTVTYTGYRGEIKDGEVTDSEEDGYLFESEPKGDLYGNEQDFHLYFAKDKLHIMWAETCDYLLDRGDGSAESVEDYEVPFDESATYKKIEEILDENYDSLEHDMAYDEKNRELNIYFQAPDNLRAALKTQDADLLESWNNLIESMKTLSESILKVVEIGGNANGVNIYWVDKLNSENEYTQSDYVLWVRNGEVKYNCADDSSSPASSSSQKSGESGKKTEAAASTEISPASDSHTPTFGEQNALESAHQYLNYTAFSYTGLIEQLEYEGYTHSEAVYAADHCGADWKQQAVKMARQYLDYSSFSRSELKDQLEFEGFTSEQAEYAVGVVY